MPTLKEEPSESEITSHALTLRAGIIRKIASGIYASLPVGFRVLKNIEEIVREEMNKSGAIELLLPAVQPSEQWKESGRWSEYGPEMFRLKDRNQRDFCLGPTHEELITNLARLNLKSYRDLPKNLYQIQVKFRDEIRPRYGLLRAREFIMKDAYSFCGNEGDLDKIYQKMHVAYSNIVERIGLKYRIVEADTGLIGGKSSHEFMIIAKEGEEKLVYCPKCSYASNFEMARFLIGTGGGKNIGENDLNEIKEVHTPGIADIEELAKFLKVKAWQTVKTILVADQDSRIYAFLVRGDRELNIGGAGKFLNKKLGLAENDDSSSDLEIGFLGPVKLRDDIEIYADNSLKEMNNLIVGANKKDYHLTGVNHPRDFKVKQWGDFSYPVPGDRCLDCGSALEFEKGIEIGHIFKLGKKYSEKMNAKFLDKDGKLKPFIMGCYGIGVSRIMSAAIEQNHDDKGIIWPIAIAPFLVNLIATTTRDEDITAAADRIYEILLDLDVEILYDDRDVSAGIKFKDSDLIGIPLRFIVGKNFLKSKKIDVEIRKDQKKLNLSPEEIPQFIEDFKKENS